jgi:hypothetical protein
MDKILTIRIFFYFCTPNFDTYLKFYKYVLDT